jgi:hypothetical protein
MNSEKEVKFDVPETVVDEPVDLNKYVLSEEDKSMMTMTNLINVYQKYFNMTYKKTETEDNYQNMFENIDFNDATSTNKCMEYFFESIKIYQELKAKDEKLVQIHPPDDTYVDNFDETYTIIVDDDIKGVTNCLYSAIKFVAELPNTWDSYWYIMVSNNTK